MPVQEGELRMAEPEKVKKSTEIPVPVPDWLSRELKNRVTVSPDLEKLIFVGVINRTNTGALTTAIGRAPTETPITRHIQPVKAIARGLVAKRSGIAASTPLEYLKDTVEIGPGTQLIKETIGPNFENPAEWMETMQLLIEAGVDPRKIVFIPTFREPLDTFLSWMKMWNWDVATFPYDSFVFSYQKSLEMIQFAEKMGMTVVPYIHEFLRDLGATKTLTAMMGKAGLPFSEDMVNWSDEEDAYWQGTIVKYDVPPNNWIQGALSVTKGGRGGLVWRAPSAETTLTASEQQLVMQKIQKADRIYKQMVALARKSLRR